MPTFPHIFLLKHILPQGLCPGHSLAWSALPQLCLLIQAGTLGHTLLSFSRLFYSKQLYLFNLVSIEHSWVHVQCWGWAWHMMLPEWMNSQVPSALPNPVVFLMSVCTEWRANWTIHHLNLKMSQPPKPPEPGHSLVTPHLSLRARVCESVILT